MFKARARELYASLTPLNNAIVKLEIDPANSDNGVLDPNVEAEIDNLKAQRDEIKGRLDTLGTTWLPSMPEPLNGSITSPVPTLENGSQAKAGAHQKGIIRRSNLPRVREQNPSLKWMNNEQLIHYLDESGYLVK